MSPLRFIATMAWRESRASRRRLLLLTGAIAIGVGALTAINSLTDNLQGSVDQQARALMGADLTVSSGERFSRTADSLIDVLACSADTSRAPDCRRANRALVTSFSGMAYVTGRPGTRLVQVMAVDGGYPYYGEIKTEPAGEWQRLQSGRLALVDPSFLTALGAQPGDTVALGEGRFVIAGIITTSSGDVGVRAALGPRIYIPGHLLEETRLLTFGARASYQAYVRVAAGGIKSLADKYRAPLAGERARLRTVDEDQQDLKEFLDQLGRYLGLVAIVALLLGGLGVASAVQVFIRQKQNTVAILRCLGASAAQVFGVYLLQALALGLIGSLLGAAIGVALQLGLPAALQGVFRLDVTPSLSWAAIATGIGTGLWITFIFALLPLLSIRSIPPLAALRRDFDESGPRPQVRGRLIAVLFLALSVVALASLQVGQLGTGAAFAGGVAGALLVLWLAALGLVRAVRRWFPHRWAYVWRQGLANLYRPANQTVTVVLAIGFGAFLLGTVLQVQSSLLRVLSLDASSGRPNLVFFDIQPDQLDGVEAELETDHLSFGPPVPIVPMRILSVKGRPVKDILIDTTSRGPDGQPRGRWAFRREYRSTYRDTTVGSEKLVVGDWWKPHPKGGPADRRTGGPNGGEVIPISMEAGVAGELGVTVRDTIVWDIQGVPLMTRIVNLREVNWARFEPNFFVVFPTGALEQAPQTWVILTREEDAARRGTLQRRLVEKFPNVTTIDISLIQQAVEKVVDRVVLAIRFMALFSLATGGIVLLGALATSRFQRLRESALLKTLGATRRQVTLVMFAEYLSLGTLAALVGLTLSTAAGWALTKWVFEIRFVPPWFGALALYLTIVGLTVLTGFASGVEVYRKTALEVLRAE